jgi:hypothetical protein
VPEHNADLVVLGGGSGGYAAPRGRGGGGRGGGGGGGPPRGGGRAARAEADHAILGQRHLVGVDRDDRDRVHGERGEKNQGQG